MACSRLGPTHLGTLFAEAIFLRVIERGIVLGCTAHGDGGAGRALGQAKGGRGHLKRTWCHHATMN